jgi:patatin-related protein
MDGQNLDSESLLPSGHKLDLLVTVTDFYGSERTIFTHDPPAVREREHRHILRFEFERPKAGKVRSDFDLDNLPSLAFAARASASYPGAFPPAQIEEIDSVLAARQMSWPARERFLDLNFGHYRALGMNAEEAVLLDGSVLDNKPIFATVQAVRSHAAFREVDRRLIYIDPHPYKSQSRTRLPAPGFFTTIRGALSDLPRHEPISDELAEISRLNEQIRRLKSTIAVTRPKIIALVDELTEGGLSQPFSLEDLRRWRIAAAGLMARTEMLHSNWFRSLLLESVDLIAQLITTVLGYTPGSPAAQWISEVIEAWAQRNGIFSGSFVMPQGVDSDLKLPPAGSFVVNFGVQYKRRRLTFVIQAINDLYPRVREPGFCPTSSGELDLLKGKMYQCLEALDVYDSPTFLSADLSARVRELFETLRPSSEALSVPSVSLFVETYYDAITTMIGQLGRECDLASVNENTDVVLAALSASEMGGACRREIISSYLGFVYWDILLLPTISALNLGAGKIEEILVDRISPEDAKTITLGDGGPSLLGGSFIGFGGFLSRAIRENDYLWGRLHAIDRLFDLVASTVPVGDVSGLDIRELKKRAFEAVLRSEAQRLRAVPELIERVRAAVARL